MSDPNHQARAKRLTTHIANGLAKGDLCSITTTVYDTAWVSMVSIPDGSRSVCAFPTSLNYIIENQSMEGGWAVGEEVAEKALSSLAGLLALVRHRGRSPTIEDIESRIQRAFEYLGKLLSTWSPVKCDSVGIEILVPALLDSLEQAGYKLRCLDHDKLLAVRDKKLSVLDARFLYRSEPCTLLHSLEAFEGRIDYDKLRHHKVNGSMMGSPASTAAYLINSSVWDEEAAAYLKKVIDDGPGQGNGAVSSVFPIPIFESSWVISVLIEAGYKIDALCSKSLDAIKDYLLEVCTRQKGLLGFAPGIEADADDTARAYLTLQQLGCSIDVSAVAKHFKTKHGHLQTYLNERNPSLTVNCNALNALLMAPKLDELQKDIELLTNFVCQQWFGGDHRDKWNMSPQYSMMLLSETLVHLLEKWDDGCLPSLSPVLLERVAITLMQILSRTMSSQNNDGHWCRSCSPEVAAYAILTLKAIIRVPWIDSVRDYVSLAIQSGQTFLEDYETQWATAEKIWIEKVPYGSPTLSEAYCVAAVAPIVELRQWSSEAKLLIRALGRTRDMIFQLFSSLPSTKNLSRWMFEVSLIESQAFVPALERANVLPKQESAKNEYFILIPFTWVFINNFHGLHLDANLLHDLIILTLYNFRVDEVMESTLRGLDKHNRDELRSFLSSICETYQASKTPSKSKESCVRDQRTPGKDPAAELLGSLSSIWPKYIDEVLSNPRFDHCGTDDMCALQHELQDFLLSHIDHYEQSEQLTSQDDWNPKHPTEFQTSMPLKTWLATTGGKSVSCQFAFAYLLCLQRTNRKSCFQQLKQSYVAQDMCAHLAIMSRLYNDLGSLKRDLSEGCLNAVNFRSAHSSSEASLDMVVHRQQLSAIADYERKEATRLLEVLQTDLASTGADKRLSNSLTLFVRVAELYADMYVVRDLSNAASA